METGKAGPVRRLGAGLPAVPARYNPIQEGRPEAMRLCYIDESEDPRCYVRIALGLYAERWNDLHRRVRD